MNDVSIPAVFLAGILSFLSPCVLPLVPPYLTYLAGQTAEELINKGTKKAQKELFFAALLFVLGFSTVFIGLGATASAFGQVLRANLEWLSALAGLAIMGMGLHFLGLFKLAWLYREKRLHINKPLGLWGGYVMGLAFAFGWTPCIGPVLAAILAVAGSEETVWRGAALLAVYSAGLGVPFLLAATALEGFTRLAARFRHAMPIVERLTGVALVVTGIAFLTGGFSELSYWLIETFPALAKLG
jgi:cytochrome c-type biogenesis protein